MTQAFIFGLTCFYAGLIVSCCIAIFCAITELKTQARRFQARKPRLMAVYNRR